MYACTYLCMYVCMRVLCVCVCVHVFGLQTPPSLVTCFGCWFYLNDYKYIYIKS